MILRDTRWREKPSKGINQRRRQTTIMDLPAVAVGSGDDSPPWCL